LTSFKFTADNNLTNMILYILLILSGLILAVEFVRQIPVIGDELEAVISGLSRFSKLIGALTLILGVLKFFWHPVLSLVSAVVGLVLLIDHLDEVPGVGGPLKKLAETVEPFDEWIGLAGIVMGLLMLF